MFKIKLFIIQTIDSLARKVGTGSSIAGFIDSKLKFGTIKYVDLENVEVIFVMGTNGKTTTTNMMYDLIASKKNVVTNKEGANLLSGIKTTVLRNTNYDGSLKGEVLLLEVDEFTLREVIRVIKPTKILITNFFRDQLDRYGEIDSVINQIVDVIGKCDACVYLNGCDPLIVSKFNKLSNEIIYYDMKEDRKVVVSQNKIVELKYCPTCLTKLDYNFYHYGHIGDYNCSGCDFKLPISKHSITVDYVQKNLSINDINLVIDVDKFPTYFYFNIIAAYAMAADVVDVKLDTLNKLLNEFVFPRGRNQVIFDENREIYFNLVKNVVGLEETVDYVTQKYNKVDLLICFNDNFADGRDVSWIWDANIESLQDITNSVTIVGLRRYDMAIRFDIEGFKNINVLDGDMEQDIIDTLNITNNDLCLISNYTPLVSVDIALDTYKKSKGLL